MVIKQIAHWQVYDDVGRRKYLNSVERARFLAAADRLDPAPRALCHTLIFTGCRISEALRLTIFQLDTEHGALTIRTLKRRQVTFRSVPIPSTLVALLLKLPHQADGSFWTIHRATAWRIVKRTMAEVGIIGPMACCKGARHGFGMHAASRNIPPNLIQRWMGHASSGTTWIYIDAVGAEEQAFALRMW